MKQMNAKMNEVMWNVYFKLQEVKENCKEALSNQDGDAYIDTVVKILIAVVVGALLLWGLYKLMGETVMVEVTQKVKDLFSKTQTNAS